jgi:Toxin SymE, type I toxin-antitoxin system
MNTYINLRKLKISSHYKKTIFKKPILNPKLTISGNWLKNAGFEIGESVTITVNKNQLIITKI